jgi:hypothetical protein
MTSNNLLFLKDRTQVVPAAKGTPEYDQIIKLLQHEDDAEAEVEEADDDLEEEIVKQSQAL